MLWGAIGLLVVLAARFYPFHVLPLRACPFLTITGLPCPTCGMTRCFMAMSRLDLAAGWRLSPLGAVLFVGTACYVVYAAVVLIGRLPRIRVRFRSVWELRALVAAVVVVVLVNWVYIVLSWPPGCHT